MFEEDVDDTAARAGAAKRARFGAQDIGWQALSPTIAVVILSTSVVTLRWYTRCRIVRCVGWDDIVILFSLVLRHAPT